MTASGWVGAAARGVLFGAIFLALTILAFERLPLRVGYAGDSTLGLRPLKDAIGGVETLRFGVATVTLDDILGMSEDTKASWMDASRPRRRLGDDEDTVVAADLPQRPEGWPLAGGHARYWRPLVAVLAIRGAEIHRRTIEWPGVVEVPALIVAVDRDLTTLVLVFTSALLAFVCTCRSSRGSCAGRLGRGLIAGVSGCATALPGSLLLAYTFRPRLSPEWSVYVDEMLRRGLMAPLAPEWTEHVAAFGAAAGAFLASAVLSAIMVSAPRGAAA